MSHETKRTRGVITRGMMMAQAAFLGLLLSACASADARSDYDPLETINRKVFAFNLKADQYLLKPVAKGYDWVVPEPVQGSIASFFANLRFPVNFLNNLLQAKPGHAGGELGRFLVNSTVGLGGLFDPASSWGLEPHKEGFGQTLGVWGAGAGPYLVLPFFGPSNPRDTTGLVVDIPTLIYPFVVSSRTGIGSTALDVVNDRSRSIETIETSRAAALDFYVFARDAYFQQRKQAILDGAVPQTTPDEDPYDEDLYDDTQFDDNEENGEEIGEEIGGETGGESNEKIDE